MACAWNTLCQQLLLVLQAKCAVGLADPLAELTCIPTDTSEVGEAFKQQTPNLGLRTGEGREWHKSLV